jgi:hypothetical protein
MIRIGDTVFIKRLEHKNGCQDIIKAQVTEMLNQQNLRTVFITDVFGGTAFDCVTLTQICGAIPDFKAYVSIEELYKDREYHDNAVLAKALRRHGSLTRAGGNLLKKLLNDL